MLVQPQGDLGLEGQPRAFQDDFGGKLISHGTAVYPIVLVQPNLLYFIQIKDSYAGSPPVGNIRSQE
jgi:hypothetical protein